MQLGPVAAEAYGSGLYRQVSSPVGTTTYGPAPEGEGSTGFAEEEELPPDVSAALEAEDCAEPAFSAASGDSCWHGPRCASPEECSAFSEPRAALIGEKRPRLRWNPQLHALFVAAVAGLGGPEKAQPRTIQQAMRVEGLTLFHVKSHLQKYRRSLRTDGDALDASGEPRKRPVRRRAHYWRHPAQQQPPAGGGAEAVPAAALWGKECAPGGRSAEPVGRGAAALGAGLEQWLGEAADGGAGYDALAALQAGSAQLALQKRLEAHVEVRLEEAHALGVHTRFVAPPAAHLGGVNPQLAGMSAVFERAMAAMGPTAPALAAPLSASLKPSPPGQCPDWAALRSHGGALGHPHGHAAGGEHPKPELHPGQDPTRPLSAGALLDEFIGAMPLPLEFSSGSGSLAFALPQGGAAAGSAGCGAPNGASLHGSSVLESLGSLESAATATGGAPSAGRGRGATLGAMPLGGADAGLDGLDSSLDACTFDALCHQLILAHSGGGGGSGSGRPGGPGQFGGGEPAAAGDDFDNWRGGGAAGCPVAHGCQGGTHDALVDVWPWM